MQLDPAEKRGVWWDGALKGTASGAVLGAALGAIAATIIGTAAIGLWPAVAVGAVVAGLGNGLIAGHGAVALHHQNKHNMMYDARISSLEQREQVLEEALSTSQTVKKILAHGPTTGHSFTESLEESRNQDTAERGPTIH